MQRTAIVFLSLLLPMAFAVASPQSPIVLGDKNSYELAGHMEILNDPTLKMDFSEVLAASAEGGFRHIDGNLNEGYRKEACWVRFTVNRSPGFSDKAWLRIAPNYIDELMLFIQIPGRDPTKPPSYSTVVLGDHIPVDERPLLHPDFVVPFDMPSDVPIIVYARLFNKGSLSFAGCIHTSEDLRDHTYRDIIIQSGYLSIALAICLMNLIFYISIRDSLFLYFSLYVLTVFINTIALEGILTLLLPGTIHLVSDYLVNGGIGLQILVFSEFAYKLFRSVAGSLSLIYMRLMSVLGFATMLAVPFGLYSYIAPLAFMGILSLILLMLVLSTRLLADMPQSGIFIFLAFFISTAGYFYMLFRLMGVIPLDSAWDINTIQPANLIHMMLISLALSERLRMAERALGDSSRLAEKRATELAEEMTGELLENKERLEVALAAEHLSAERQNRFLSMVSHEYRTPLAIIQGNLDILELQLPAEEISLVDRPEVKKMRRAVQRLVDVMEVSLEQSRIMDPKVRGELKSIPFQELVLQQLEAVKWMWPERSFIFNDSLNDERIQGELPLLNTVLFNLLDNAQKYSAPGTPVVIDSAPVHDGVSFRIVNTVKEIVPANLEKLFEKYTRGWASRDTSGAGLGLWLVRQIIEQHGGKVFLDVVCGDKVEVSFTLPSEVSA